MCLHLTYILSTLCHLQFTLAHRYMSITYSLFLHGCSVEPYAMPLAQTLDFYTMLLAQTLQLLCQRYKHLGMSVDRLDRQVGSYLRPCSVSLRRTI